MSITPPTNFWLDAANRKAKIEKDTTTPLIPDCLQCACSVTILSVSHFVRPCAYHQVLLCILHATVLVHVTCRCKAVRACKLSWWQRTKQTISNVCWASCTARMSSVSFMPSCSTVKTAAYASLMLTWQDWRGEISWISLRVRITELLMMWKNQCKSLGSVGHLHSKLENEFCPI